MHCPPPSPSPRIRGLTLIEVTLVVTTLLGLIAVLFIGVGSYKEGANRAICVQQVATMQKAIRAYCNMHQIEPGQTVSNIKSRIINPTGFIRQEPSCSERRNLHLRRGSHPGHGRALHGVLYPGAPAFEHHRW